MRPVFVVVANILVNESFQVAFVEHDHVVEQIAATTPHEAFRNPILPRALETGPLGLSTEALDSLDHVFVEVRSAVEDQVAWCGVIGKGFTELLHNPSACWIPSHVEVKNLTPVMQDDKEAIEHAECESGYGEEIHSGDGFAMIAQECRPSFCRPWVLRRFPHPVQHGPLRNVESQHPELAMNARCSPSGIIHDDTEDQVTQLLTRRFSTATDSLPRDPIPVQLESSTMPVHDRRRLHDKKGLSPAMPMSTQYYPKQLVWQSRA